MSNIKQTEESLLEVVRILNSTLKDPLANKNLKEIAMYTSLNLIEGIQNNNGELVRKSILLYKNALEMHYAHLEKIEKFYNENYYDNVCCC